MLGSPRAHRVDRHTKTHQNKQRAQDQSDLELDVAEGLVECRVWREQALRDREYFCENSESDSLETQQHENGGIEKCVHIERHAGHGPGTETTNADCKGTKIANGASHRAKCAGAGDGCARPERALWAPQRFAF